MKKNILILIAVVFLVTRFFAFDLIYHQDEYKWANIADPKFGLGLESDHPPLVGLLYRLTGTTFGFDHLRVLPIVVSLASLLLLYAVVKRMYSRKTAVWTSLILIVSTYALIANSQIDIDGALLPFFGLLSLYAYMRTDFSAPLDVRNRKWFSLFLVSITLGFMIKVSFVLFLAAIATDYFLRYKPKIKKVLPISFGVICAIILSGLIIILINRIFGITHAERFVENTTHFGFFNFSGRNYFQVLFLSVKSLILASPLLLAGLVVGLWGRKNIIKHRFWLIYIFYNIIFYFVIFDFSNRTLERYLMFIIIPFAVMLGEYLAGIFKNISVGNFISRFIFFLAPSGVLALFLFSLPYKILPLNPKSAYIDAVKGLHLNFLLPITGGSGPVGMYVLVSFVTIFFLIAGILFLAALILRRKNRLEENFIIGFLALAFVYNFVLSAELVSGFLYGSVNKVTKDTVTLVNKNPEIEKVITYYDIAGHELFDSGKYYKRFYTDPMFAETNISKFADYEGYYMVVDFPEIDKNSVYWKYFEKCKETSHLSDKNINSYIFDCRSTFFSQ